MIVINAFVDKHDLAELLDSFEDERELELKVNLEKGTPITIKIASDNGDSITEFEEE